MAMIYTYDGTNSSCNLTTAAATNACDIYFRFKQTLVQAGWTVVKSSDGVTSDGTGNYLNDRITGGYGTGANNLNNASAWFVLKAPGAVGGMTRQICIQRSASSQATFNIYYSASAGFTGGGLTTAPTATDIQTLATAAVVNAVSGTYRFSIAADNAAPYGFYLFTFPVGGGNPFYSFVMDPMTTGTYNSSDTDPYIIYITNASPFLYAGMYSEVAGTGPYSYYKKGLTGETFVTVPANVYYDASRIVIPNGLPANPFSSKDNIFPIPYVRRSGLAMPNGLKGLGSLMKWAGTSRSTGDTLSISSSGAKDYVVVGHVALPWNGSTPTV